MIKTIIFDFGDVFLNLEKPATQRELSRYEVNEFSEEMLEKNKAYEKGEISSEEFVNFYCTRFSLLTPKAFKNSWNAILLDFPKHRLDFLKKLADHGEYNLILLSNTNNVHIDWVKENIKFFEDFKDCFDAFYLSQEIGFRKPDPEIFEFVLEKHDLKPEETLFIDDTKENTDAAAALGIHIWNIDPATEDVTELFTTKRELF